MADPGGSGIARVLADGRLIFAGATMRAAYGRGGMRRDKTEGDGATPVALLPIRRIFYRADRVVKPRCLYPCEPTSASDGWCDDPSHRDYNRHVLLPHDGRHEALWREDAVYDIVAVLGWNDAPVVRGRGSAIFLHAARPDYAPTEGCVALALPDLVRLLGLGLSGLEISPG